MILLQMNLVIVVPPGGFDPVPEVAHAGELAGAVVGAPADSVAGTPSTNQSLFRKLPSQPPESPLQTRSSVFWMQMMESDGALLGRLSHSATVTRAFHKPT